MKKYLMILAGAILMNTSVNAQETPSKKAVIAVIQTSAQCDDCKERIENALNYTKGVVYAELDDETKKVTVKYKPNVISLQEVKQKIADTGYDADEIKATDEQVKKLPLCCQPGGMKK